MAEPLLTGIYTLTGTHCGTGQTSGAVDLPIAREPHTGLPVLPASGLKGAARSTLDEKNDEGDKKLAQHLFGPDLNAQEKEGNGLGAGSLVILEGRLLLYPLRSLQRPFLYATCPLILERFARDLRALGIKHDVLDNDEPIASDLVLVTNEALAGQTLVVEDLVYKADEVGQLSRVNNIAKALTGLLPDSEKAARKRLAKSVVVLPDEDFVDVVQRAVPVQARIKLNSETKTTTGDGGNLWYEEALPPDCLFAVLVTKRAGHRKNGTQPVDEFSQLLGRNGRRSIQIGGNETVGQGFCWWTTFSGNQGGKGAARG